MAIALSAVLSPSRWPAADAVGVGVFSVWISAALVFMFAAGGRRSMPLVGALGFVAAMGLALWILWATAGRP